MTWTVDTDLTADEERLEALVDLMLDLRPFWPRVVPLFVGWMGRQFASEGTYFNTPWAPLSADYAAWKSVRYPGKGILVAEGDLRRGASFPERDAKPQSLTLKVTWPKTIEPGDRPFDPNWHHLGRGNVPARPLLSDDLPLDAQAELDKAFDEYVEEMASAMGF
jgi:hypothetical protein